MNKKIKCDIQKLETQKQKLQVLLKDHKPSCLEPSPEPSPVVDYQQPPTFLPQNVPNTTFVKDADMTILDQCPNEVVSTNLMSSDATPLDFPDTFLKNPGTITLPIPHNVAYDEGKHCKRNYLPQQMLLDTNCRYNVPSLNFLDEQNNNNYYDLSYSDGTENGCMV